MIINKKLLIASITCIVPATLFSQAAQPARSTNSAVTSQIRDRASEVYLKSLEINIVTKGYSGDIFDDATALAALISAMKERYRLEQSEVTNQDYRSYFKSERFVQDFNDGKWSGGLNVIIDKVPLGLSGGASKEQLSTFQEKIENANSVQLSKETQYAIATETLNVDAMAQFRGWLEAINERQGFRMSAIDSGSLVIFKISFSKDINIPWPAIRSLRTAGGSVIQESDVRGRILDAPIIVHVKRNPEDQVVLTLETDLGSAIKIAPPSEIVKRNTGLPIGTVVASIFPLETFLKAVGERLPYDSRKSSWAPADGRDVASSEFVGLSNSAKLPDLRGVFLRGLNKFDPSEATTVSQEQADPESTRSPLSLQLDAFKSHNHNFDANMGGQVNRETGNYGSGNTGTSRAATAHDGGDETRPKNRALYFYIKIR